jgi:hypothetical protein
MRPGPAEIEYLSAWAREEWKPDCYRRPAHQLQVAHRVAGAHLIDLIKAWTAAEGKKDQDILAAADNPSPSWPWPSEEELRNRLHLAVEATRTAGAVRSLPAD